MSEKNSQGGRFLEYLLYGTPIDPGSTTPDGRMVTELHRGRMDIGRRGDESLALQRETIRALRDLHGGAEVITRDAYLAKEEETQGILRDAAAHMAGMEFRQVALLEESRFLSQVTSQGFSAMGQSLQDVREGVGHVEEAVEAGTRTLQGPSYSEGTITEMLVREQSLVEILGAYRNGLLAPRAVRELMEWVDSRMAAPEMRRAIDHFLDERVPEGHEELKAQVRQRTFVLDHPSELLGSRREEAAEALGVLSSIATESSDGQLLRFTRQATAMVRLAEHSQKGAVSEGLLIDLTNHGLTTDAIQHEVKAHYRGARREGSGVDRNYNLMELLDQGDHARTQREVGIQQRSHLILAAEQQWRTQLALLDQGRSAQDQRGVAQGQRQELIGLGETAIAVATRTADGTDQLVIQGDTAEGQRASLIGLSRLQLRTQVATGIETHRHLDRLAALGEEGNERLTLLAEQGAALLQEADLGNRQLGRVVDSLGVANGHLVNLEVLGMRFIETMEDGFSGVSSLLRQGFAMEQEGLANIAMEVAMTRAEIAGSIANLEETLERVGATIQREIIRTNELLQRLIDLTEHPLRTRARERLTQAVAVLKDAKDRPDFEEARHLFEEATQEDPTIMEAQYGAGTTAEVLKDWKAAIERYRRVGRRGKPDQSSLAAVAWQGVARIREQEGDLPEAISSLRSALERESGNLVSRWMLARALGKAGLATEATDLLTQLVADQPDYLYEIQNDSAFDALPLQIFYANLWKEHRVRRINDLLILARELILLGSLDEAVEIIQSTLDLGPLLLLRTNALELPLMSRIQNQVKNHLRSVSKQPTLPHSAEDWYALAFLSIQMGLSAEGIQTLRNGLAQDSRSYQHQGPDILAALEIIGGANRVELDALIRSQAPDLTWILQ